MYKIELELVRQKLARQYRTNAELAGYLGINKNTMVSIFKAGICKTDQFERMVMFLDSSLLDFIVDDKTGKTVSLQLKDYEETQDEIKKMFVIFEEKLVSTAVEIQTLKELAEAREETLNLYRDLEKSQTISKPDKKERASK